MTRVKTERTRSRWTPKMAATSLFEELSDALPEFHVSKPQRLAIAAKTVQIYTIAIVKPDSKGRPNPWGAMADGAVVQLDETFDVTVQNYGDEALLARIRRVVGTI